MFNDLKATKPTDIFMKAIRFYVLNRLVTRKITFAGRSARRRIKYGYQCVPYGT